jgi:hypothetical protein
MWYTTRDERELKDWKEVNKQYVEENKHGVYSMLYTCHENNMTE